MERNTWIEEYVNLQINKLNEQYPGIVSSDKANIFIRVVQETNITQEEIERLVTEKEKQVIENYQKLRNSTMSEVHYDLNELFDCRITNNTLHIHVVPKSVKAEIKNMGLKKYLKYADSRLVDAFTRIGDIIQLPENDNIETIFAVSPLLKHKTIQGLFRKYQFDVKKSDNPYFISMFKTDDIGEASIPRDKFLAMLNENTQKDISIK